jgi:hypothetical protein
MLMRRSNPRRVRRSVVKRRRARRGYSRARRDTMLRSISLVSIVTIPAMYGEDGFWFRH